MKGLTKVYGGKKNTEALSAVDDVSLEVAPGTLVSIIGRSGAGKSTLLRCLNRLIEPTSGSVEFNGQDMLSLHGKKLRLARRKISMVFQNYNLIYRSTVIDNVLQGRLGYKNTLTGALGIFSEEDKDKALDMLERVGLSQYCYTRADQLSGGQKQRVGIARALTQEPLLVLADEPISSLDPKSSREVMELLRWAVDELKVSCLVSLHQTEYAVEFSDYIYGLSDGKLCCQGEPSYFSTEMLASVYD